MKTAELLRPTPDTTDGTTAKLTLPPNPSRKISTESEMVDFAVQEFAGKTRLGQEWTHNEAAEFGRFIVGNVSGTRDS